MGEGDEGAALPRILLLHLKRLCQVAQGRLHAESKKSLCSEHTCQLALYACMDGQGSTKSMLYPLAGHVWQVHFQPAGAPLCRHDVTNAHATVTSLGGARSTGSSHLIEVVEELRNAGVVAGRDSCRPSAGMEVDHHLFQTWAPALHVSRFVTPVACCICLVGCRPETSETTSRVERQQQAHAHMHINLGTVPTADSPIGETRHLHTASWPDALLA